MKAAMQPTWVLVRLRAHLAPLILLVAYATRNAVVDHWPTLATPATLAYLAVAAWCMYVLLRDDWTPLHFLPDGRLDIDRLTKGCLKRKDDHHPDREEPQ